MLRFEHLSKTFGSTAALTEVSFTVATGSVHGVLGENGAGKSTLMQVLSGLITPDQGVITIDDQPLRLGSPTASRQAGIGMVHQHFMQVPTLSVLDNVALATWPGAGIIDRMALSKRIDATAATLTWHLNPQAVVADLSVGERQRLEIITALIASGGARGGSTRILVLDEPTAVLAPQEVDEFLSAVRRLAAAGTTVLFIGHKLHEVERLCDEVTVLRRGRVVRSCPMTATDRLRLTRDMLGVMPIPAAPRPSVTPGAVMIQVSDATIAGEPGAAPLIDRASFSVHAGELVGIAGVDGNGQSALVESLIGLRAVDAGSILIAGQAVHAGRRPADLAVIPEDRQRQALIGGLPVWQNLLLGAHDRRPYARWGWLNLSAWRDHARGAIRRFDVRPQDPNLSAASLSGGNQQKVVVARELDGEPAVVVAMNPTRGLDIGAADTVWKALETARLRGAAVLLVHSDLDELLAVADRVLVCHSGRLTDSGWPDCERAHLGALMLGAVMPDEVPA